MKRIFWVTSSNFFDVDEKIVPALSRDYDIYWCLLCSNRFFYSREFLEDALRRSGAKGEVVDLPKLSTPQSVWMHFRLIWKLRKGKFDIGYFDYLGLPYFVPFIKLLNLNKNKIIFACHDFLEHIGSPNRKLTLLYKKALFKNFKHIHFLSKSQKALYEAEYDGAPHYAPMTLKGFGAPSAPYAPGEVVRFLFFGRIEERKGLEYVIEAGNILQKKYPGKFVIKIAGGCSDWDKYESLIEDRGAFEIDIRRIENEEIPDLLTGADLMLLPYKEVTQSGPLFIAYNYGLPIIASDHPGFAEYIEDGRTGLLFKNMDAADLAQKMGEVIERKQDLPIIRQNLSKFVEENLTIEKIAQKYAEMFDSI